MKRGYSLAKGEGEAWLFRGLGEVHVPHCEIAHREDIVRDKSLHRTRTIMDLKGSSIGLVGLGGIRIILLVEEARNRCALAAGNPKVTRSKRNKC